MRFLRESTVCKVFGKLLAWWARCRLRRDLRGQSTVEYAVVFAAFLAMVIGLGALSKLFESGLVLDHALQSASHHLKSAATAAWADIFLY